jgi:phosphatidylglycerol:prolipoprotein diacylglycerol transferase
VGVPHGAASFRQPEAALDAAVYGLVGGLLGAKLLYVFEHLSESPFLSLFLDRGGMSWFGGFVGGFLAGFVTIRVKRWPMIAVLAAATPALAVGQMLGRVSASAALRRAADGTSSATAPGR